MTAIKARASIGADGTLRLAVPVDLPAGEADVVLVVESNANVADATASPTLPPGRSGLFTDDPKCHALDVDAALKEMNDAWKAKFADIV